MEDLWFINNTSSLPLAHAGAGEDKTDITEQIAEKIDAIVA